MFKCDTKHAYKRGYNKGFYKGISFRSESNSFLIFNAIISFLTLCVLLVSLFYSYKSWKDNRYIENITRLNNVYYDSFTNNIGVSEYLSIFIGIEETSIDRDLNSLKSLLPELTEKLNLNEVDLNKISNDLLEYYIHKIKNEIKNSSGSIELLNSSLENVKLIMPSLDKQIDDFWSNTLYVQYLFFSVKKNIEQDNNIEMLRDFYDAVIKNREMYESLIKNIKIEIN